MTDLDSKLLHGVCSISANPQANDDAIVETLEKQGFDHIGAELLAGFAPLALGRLLLERVPACVNLNLSKVIEVRDVDSSRRLDFELESIKAFQDLKRIVSSALESRQLSSGQLLAVALRSPEVKAVNTLLQMKENLDGFIASPVIMLRLKLEWINLNLSQGKQAGPTGQPGSEPEKRQP